MTASVLKQIQTQKGSNERLFILFFIFHRVFFCFHFSSFLTVYLSFHGLIKGISQKNCFSVDNLPHSFSKGTLSANKH